MSQREQEVLKRHCLENWKLLIFWTQNIFAFPLYLSGARAVLRGRKRYRCTLAERGDLYRIAQVADV